MTIEGPKSIDNNTARTGSTNDNFVPFNTTNNNYIPANITNNNTAPSNGLSTIQNTPNLLNNMTQPTYHVPLKDAIKVHLSAFLSLMAQRILLDFFSKATMKRKK